MIDQATGHERAFVEQFAAWFNKNVWGEFNALSERRNQPWKLCGNARAALGDDQRPMSEKSQISPDLVVKFHCIDIVNVI